MSEPIDMTPLDKYRDRGFERRIKRDLPSPRPDKFYAGRIGFTAFTVLSDRDGHCEAGLSCAFGEPSDAQQAEFWRIWGVTPDEPTAIKINGGRGLHWVVRRGVRQ